MKLTIKDYTIEGTHEDIAWFLENYPPYQVKQDIRLGIPYNVSQSSFYEVRLDNLPLGDNIVYEDEDNLELIK